MEDTFTGEPHAAFASPDAVNSTASAKSGQRVRLSDTCNDVSARVLEAVDELLVLATKQEIAHGVAFDASTGNGNGAQARILMSALVEIAKESPALRSG